jgi:hypothetical protein
MEIGGTIAQAAIVNECLLMQLRTKTGCTSTASTFQLRTLYTKQVGSRLLTMRGHTQKSMSVLLQEKLYLIINPAWPDWVKVGKAAIATDRLGNYQTSSPMRDYALLTSISVDNMHEQERRFLQLFSNEGYERKGEWFKISKEKAVELLAL